MAIPQTPARVRKLFYRTIEEMERQKEAWGIACSEKGITTNGFGNEKAVASGNESG